MPRYRVETKTGTYEVEADDDSKLQAVISELNGPAPKAETSYKPSSSDMYFRGASFGLTDYPIAGMQWGIDKVSDAITGEKTPLSYEAALQDVRKGVSNYRDTDPVKAYGMEAVGGVTGSIAKGITKGTQFALDKGAQFLGKQIPRYLGYGAQGLTSGLAAGLGNAQNEQGGVPTAGDLAAHGGMGAAFGTVLGMAVPGAVEGGRYLFNKTVQPIVDRVAKSGPVNAAARRTIEALEAKGLTPQQLLAKMKVRNTDGQGMIADVLPELADDAAQVRGAAQNTANRSLTSRQGTIMSPSGQGDRLSKSVMDNLSGENFQQTVDDLATARSADAGPKYKAAFSIDEGENYRVIKDGLIDRLMERPVFQQGLKKGITDALDEAAITGDDVTLFKTYLEGANLDDPNLVLKKTPTLRILDAAKRGLDSILQGGGEEIRHPITQRLTQRGLRIEQMRSALVDKLDDLTMDPKTGESVYKAARDAWAGPSRSIDMMARGRQFVREGGADETQTFFNKLSESEKEFYRIGVSKQLREMIETSGDEANKAKKIFGNESIRRKLETIFPTRKAFNEFRKSVLVEMERAGTKQSVIGGSQTARRIAGKEQMGIDPTGPLIDLATGNPRGAGVGFLRQAVKSLNSPPASTAEELAVLFSRDPQKQQQFISSLDNRALASRLLGQTPLPRGFSAAPALSPFMGRSSNQ